MSMDKMGVIKGMKYGFVVGLVSLIIGGVANTAFGVPLTAVEFGAGRSRYNIGSISGRCSSGKKRAWAFYGQ